MNLAKRITKLKNSIKRRLNPTREMKNIANEIRKEMKYLYYKGLHPDLYEENLKDWFRERMGEELDLDNPKTYNQKIQWLKLHDSTPLKTKLADKFLVREYVKEKIGGGHLVNLLGVYDRFDDIDFASLPQKFVIKTNHACKTNWIVRDKNKLDISAAREFFNKHMNLNFAFVYGLELHYKNIIPKIIIEEYMENGGNELYDYKFYVFHGKVVCVMFMIEREKGLKMEFFDREWNLMPCSYSPINDRQIERPKNLELMIDLAEKLGSGFIHVRVDFYLLNDGQIKFGEMTFTPSSGTRKWNPKEYDTIFGSYIKLPFEK